MSSYTIRRLLTLLGALTTACIVAPSDARASEEYPAAYGQRPFVLSADLFAIDAAFTARKFDPSVSDELFSGFNVSVLRGMTDDFTLGLDALPLALTPTFKFKKLHFYGRYRLLRGPIELGINLKFALPGRTRNGDLNVGLLARFFLKKAGYVNVGVHFAYNLANENRSSLRIPVELAFTVAGNFFLQIDSGLVVPDLSGDNIVLPLGLSVGYNFASESDGPRVDLYLGYLRTSAISTHSGINDKGWAAAIGVRFFR